MYWRDTGLLHASLNTSDRETLLRQPWVGASWEGFVINQVLGALQSSGRRFDPYHLRTSDQREIDLLVQVDSELWALEIKLTTRPGPEDLARLNANADLVGAQPEISRVSKQGVPGTGCAGGVQLGGDVGVY